jgi:amino acid adenylation domain-containing protein
MRVALCSFEDAETRLLWTYHHAILDGRSRVELLRELFEIYEGKPTGERAGPPFRQFAEWAAVRGRDPATEAFWREILRGVDDCTAAPGVSLTDQSRTTDGIGGALRTTFDAPLSSALREMAAVEGLTPATVLQGAYALLLAQEADSDDVVFATTRAGRHSPPFDTTGMIGLLMVTSPVRLQCSPEESVSATFAKLREFNVAVRDFEHAPLSDLRRWSELPRSRPIAETLFAYETASMNTILRAADPAWNQRDAQLIEQLAFPLTLEALGGDEIAVTVLYDEARVPADEAARVIRRYEAIVRACVERPHASVSSVCELRASRRRELSGELVDGPAPTDAELVPARVREQIRRHPNRIAVEHAERRLTYAEIDARTDVLAGRLHELGATVGAHVAIAMSRTPDMICAVLAVHRSGAAYVPLDPRYPAERLAFMLEDSGAQIVITDTASHAALAGLERCVALIADAESPGPQAGGAQPAAGAHDLSHIIYTSGSSGTPKAVMIEHRSVAHLAAWSEATFGEEDWDGMLASTSLSFDVSVFEILVTLALGGRVVLVADILALSEPEFAHQIAFVSGVPSALSELLRVRELPRSVRTVALAGEALPATLVERLHAQPAAPAVWNLYGATEDTTHSTEYRCVPGERPLIGRPIAGTQVYVVDRHLTPVPEGVAGELLLSGLGLARGYLGRPDLTAERFRAFAFSDGAPVRAYRTGDRVRWTDGGLLDYLGRLDDQAKIRGVRVEPGEVAHALRDLPAVADAVVVVRGEGAERRLVAYVVGATGTRLDVPSLRAALALRLPAALLPSAIVELEALPLTANGKLDRDALPAPGPRTSAAASPALHDATQHALAELWREVLGLSGAFGADDDFFLLGGDSLNALHLLAAIEDRFGRRLSVGALLAATTLADQAAAIDSARSEPATSTLIALRPTGSKPAWVCVLTDERGVVGLRNVLPSVLSDQPVFAVQAIDPNTHSWRKSSIEQIAQACVVALRTSDPHGPYRLGGHSMGGLVAFEMACILAKEAEVELLILLDTLAPEVWRWPGRIASRDRLLRGESALRRARGQANLVRTAVRHSAAMRRGERLVASWPRGFDDPWDQAGAHRIMRRYRPSKLAAPVTVLHTKHGERLMGSPALGWSRHVSGPLSTRLVAGDHLSIFNAPDVHVLAAALAEELGRLDGAPAP